MLVKGLVLTAVVASTPLAFVATQDPSVLAPKQGISREQLETQQQKIADDLAETRRQLDAARAELARMQKQLERALDALDGTFAQQPRENHCAPSRRSLMSHYQWLRDEGHAERAGATLGKVVEQVGKDQNQRNATAWNLMTDEQTVGRFDDVALAIAKRMEQTGAREHHHLDTMALAHFLNGEIDRAIELEQRAIAAGGSSDDYRRRLRTYEAARTAVARTQGAPVPTGPTLIAANEQDD